MAWERRGRGYYFYSSRRRGRMVQKLYYGKGDNGELAAGVIARVAAEASRPGECTGRREGPAGVVDLGHEGAGRRLPADARDNPRCERLSPAQSSLETETCLTNRRSSDGSRRRART